MSIYFILFYFILFYFILFYFICYLPLVGCRGTVRLFCDPQQVRLALGVYAQVPECSDATRHVIAVMVCNLHLQVMESIVRCVHGSNGNVNKGRSYL
jgi:hypothetical protein